MTNEVISGAVGKRGDVSHVARTLGCILKDEEEEEGVVVDVWRA